MCYIFLYDINYRLSLSLFVLSPINWANDAHNNLCVFKKKSAIYTPLINMQKKGVKQKLYPALIAYFCAQPGQRERVSESVERGGGPIGVF